MGRGRSPPPLLRPEEHWRAAPPPPPPPSAPSRCRGHAVSTGQRCRITWNLDDFGFCKYHTTQRHAPPLPPPLPPGPPPPPPPPPSTTRTRKPAKAPPRTCAGTTKQGLPCGITWQLDALGFCKYHTELTRKCRGIARSTGQQCRIRWDLDANGYCQYHTSQAASEEGSQCVAVARSSGQRCRITTGLDASGLCGVHQRGSRSHLVALSASSSLVPGKRLCRGVVFLTGEPCTNDAKPGYDYCCAAHDPSVRYFSPRLFDAGDRPRSLLEPHVVRRYEGRDLYHGDLLDLVTPGAIELDHIFEKQCFAFAFHGVPFQDEDTDPAYLAAIVRDVAANELDNVCLTRTTTNKIKGSAVWKFLDDTITGHVASPTSYSRATFTDYMLAEHRGGKRLDRMITRTITREMGRALKSCRRKLADQGETPLVDALSHELQNVYVKMDLHSSSESSPSKYDSATRLTESTAESGQSGYRKEENHTEPKRAVKGDQSKLTETTHTKPFEPNQGMPPRGEVSNDCESACRLGEGAVTDAELDTNGDDALESLSDSVSSTEAENEGISTASEHPGTGSPPVEEAGLRTDDSACFEKSTPETAVVEIATVVQEADRLRTELRIPTESSTDDDQ